MNLNIGQLSTHNAINGLGCIEFIVGVESDQQVEMRKPSFLELIHSGEPETSVKDFLLVNIFQEGFDLE
jgi:hypothetical protein